MFKKLVLAAAFLTFIVVVVGAYVRLQDAGLGCPDWPGCYGHYVGVPQTADEIARAQQGFPQRDRKSTRLNSSHSQQSRMPSSA